TKRPAILPTALKKPMTSHTTRPNIKYGYFWIESWKAAQKNENSAQKLAQITRKNSQRAAPSYPFKRPNQLTILT
ncbi:hypothetical protein, partial [Pseudomonas syringae]|uniref:hypothetical protein n=1 Tax=Pseudomonas syringae TaxID=317 RepID=UPI001E5A9EE5